MKVAVITANFGGIDPVVDFPKQDYKCDRYYFTEKNSPFPFRDLSPRMAAKYFKICTHKILPQYEAYLWLDGQFKIKSSSFVSKMVEHLETGEVVISKHKQRKTIGEEAHFIYDAIKQGSPYLSSRYSPEVIMKELDRIGNPDLSLYMCGLFLRRNIKWTNAMFERWFEDCLLYHSFDQNSFSKFAQRMVIKTIDLGALYDNQYYSLTKHNQ